MRKFWLFLFLSFASSVQAQKKENVEVQLAIPADKATEKVRTLIGQQGAKIDFVDASTIVLNPYPMAAKRTILLTFRFNVVPRGSDSSTVIIEGTARNSATAAHVPMSMSEPDAVIDNKRGGYMQDAWKALEHWAEFLAAG
jgi:hypothetical protein